MLSLLRRPLLLPLLSGLLCWLAWPPLGFTAALFVAFIPLLALSNRPLSNYHYLLYLYLGLFTWNLATTWWIWNASLLGAWLAIFVNSLLMTLPWMGYRWVQRRAGVQAGAAALVVFWMSFEYLHQLDWGLSWPWLTLGNAFAVRTAWVQWYEYTGTSGGTLWVLAVNLLLYHSSLRAFRNLQSQTPNPKSEIPNLKSSILLRFITLLVIALPLVISRWLQPSVPPPDAAATPNVVVVQPNIDPYEKVSTGSFEAQLQELIRLSEEKIDSNTTLLVWPETALYSPNGFDETLLRENFFLTPLFAFLQRHPRLQLFTGIESYRLFNEKVSPYARPISDSRQWYEAYNGSVLLDSGGARQFYHKSMLVPGVETLPRFLLFLGPVFEKFGGTTGGYARQAERNPVDTRSGYRLAPAICYESIYGEYMSRYRAQGANLVAIITNDGWWGNTPGYRQHLAYARLRAIENRCWVVRSANTGVSCFIDPAGTVYQAQDWWTAASVKQPIPATNGSTFYARYGDLLSKAALVLSVLLLGVGWWVRKKY
ncbi:MAG TPA: apolipoprotein N-acyltransferase [Lacibacter sp.]|mgnify:CR=1 FL=1|nr:apolipoprotein N-acyltransferase [Lacibacter sp.]HMO88933.1 apolipoprotein N-acyltransferase [Lacibacter sp.]